jgi:hypothetical protein
MSFGGGYVDPEVRERIINAAEQALITVSGKSFEEGARFATKIVELVYTTVKQVQTKDELRKVMESAPEPSEHELQIILFAAENLPNLLRFGIKELSRRASTTLPTLQAGRRRKVTAQESRVVVNTVSELMVKGANLKAAKIRAAQQFGCSKRTVERIWSSRKNLPEAEITVADVLRFFSETS